MLTTSLAENAPISSVPFSFFSSLLDELSSIAFHSNSVREPCSDDGDYPTLRVFVHWLDGLRKRFTPLPEGTTRSVFRLLFPEEDVRRKYGMQESLLASYLAEWIGVPDGELQCWKAAGASGCLGLELRQLLVPRSSKVLKEQDGIYSLSIADLDDILDELASTSGHSHISLRNKYPTPRPPRAILRHLYDSLSPIEASFVTHIILKDLRPLLYPLPISYAIAVPTGYRPSSCKPLRIEDAMRAWDLSGWLLKTYRLKSIVDDATIFFEGASVRLEIAPRVGTCIEIPKSKKGRGCSNALAYMRQSTRLWAEVKYDGERAQIHIEILSAVEEKITIFSKSKRDSTHDRRAIHDTIRHAIGLCETSPTELRKVKQNVILDAEIVACHRKRIDEFWRIRCLLGDAPAVCLPCTSGASDEEWPERHLGLVFFDILILDSQSLVNLPYSRRRVLLESLIRILPGYIFLAERMPIDVLTKHSERTLQTIFAHSIANFEEGIVLKAEESLYNDWKSPWVKLKKDYIPGYGDSVDLVILGAGWDKERGRELRVAPSTFTTLFIGALMNAVELRSDATLKPHFYLATAVTYGMTREQLEEMNFIIKDSYPVAYDQCLNSSEPFDYTFTHSPGLESMPAVILSRPLLGELVGAGFTKPSRGEYYELRFPRIMRIYRRSERSWRDGVDFQHLQTIAHHCSGRERPLKDIEDWCNSLWGKTASPGVRSLVKRKALAAAWQEKLAIWDKRSTTPLAPSKRRKSVPWSPFTVSVLCDQIEQNVEGPVNVSPPANPDSEYLFRHLAESSFIWFSGESKSRSLRKELIPTGHCLHTLESLLTGCGWYLKTANQRHEIQQVKHIERGIAFVHDDGWKKFVIQVVNECKTCAGDRKPILVIEAPKSIVDPITNSRVLCRFD